MRSSTPYLVVVIQLIVLLLNDIPIFCDGRPTNPQESNGNTAIRFLNGCYVGVETVLSLLGYYDYDLGAEDIYYKLYPEQKEGYDNETKNDENDDKEEEEEDSAWAPSTMQLVCLGLGRTGTTSLALGIELLGYTVIHDDEHVELAQLYEWYEEDEISWDELNAMAAQMGYNATFKTGWEWAARHPESKVILTVRDSPEKYANSWLSAVRFIDVIESRPYRWMKNSNDLYQSFFEEYKMEPTDGKPELYKDKETLKAVYENYIKTVKANIPKERLLVFNVKQGWDPLCQFLNITDHCPMDIPFPHVHDRMKLLGEHFVITSVTYIWPFVILLPLAIPYYYFMRTKRNRQ